MENAGLEGAEKDDIAVDDSASVSIVDDELAQADGDWIPGQDSQIDYPKILEILVGFIDTSYGKSFCSELLKDTYLWLYRRGNPIDFPSLDRYIL